MTSPYHVIAPAYEVEEVTGLYQPKPETPAHGREKVAIPDGPRWSAQERQKAEPRPAGLTWGASLD